MIRIKIIVLVFLYAFLLAQETAAQIIYKPVFIDQCTQEVANNVFWSIKDSSLSYSKLLNYSEEMELPKCGIYQLQYPIFGDCFDVEVRSSGVNSDTFLLKRLNFGHYVSNPPHSEYTECGELANGEIIDYYWDGKVRMKGVFEDGQPVDSLFSYYRNGQLSELFLSTGTSWKRVEYFENGQLKSTFDSKRRIDIEYYENGQIKRERNRRIRHHYLEKEYFRNGTLKAKNNFKVMKSYDLAGDLLDKVELLNSSFVSKILSKGAYDPILLFADYKWSSYNDGGARVREIYFSYHRFWIRNVPKDLETIDYNDFEKIIFYKHGDEAVKIESKLVNENDEYVTKIFVYQKEGVEWVEEMVTEGERIYELIRKYSER